MSYNSELNVKLNTLTIKKIDIAINSFKDQKKRNGNLSKGTQKKLDGLIEKYQNKKKQILTVYDVNSQDSTNRTKLVGVDKQNVTLNQLADLIYGKADGKIFDQKGVKITKGVVLGGMGALSVGCILWEQLAKNIPGEQFEAAKNAFLKFFTETIGGFIKSNPATFAGILLGAGAIGTAIVFSVKKAKKKAKEQKLMMEEEAEQKMNAGVKSRDMQNFGAASFSSNKESIINEVLDNPDLEKFLEDALTSSAASITPIMKLNIQTVLRGVTARKNQANAKNADLNAQREVVAKAEQKDLDSYAQANEQLKELETIKSTRDKAVATYATASATIDLSGIDTLTGVTDAQKATLKAETGNRFNAAVATINASLAADNTIEISAITYSSLPTIAGISNANLTACKNILKTAVATYFNAKKQELKDKEKADQQKSDNETEAQSKLDEFNRKHGTSYTLADLGNGTDDDGIKKVKDAKSTAKSAIETSVTHTVEDRIIEEVIKENQTGMAK